jgi:hypothetical protein
VAWVGKLLDLAAPARPDELVFPLAHLARVSGDRSRDLSAPLRERVAARLSALGAPEAAVRGVREAVQLSDADEQKVFGESLPAGLKLIGDSARPS